MFIGGQIKHGEQRRWPKPPEGDGKCLPEHVRQRKWIGAESVNRDGVG